MVIFFFLPSITKNKREMATVIGFSSFLITFYQIVKNKTTSVQVLVRKQL